MGAVMLRAQSCLVCGGQMPNKSRIDRRYCKGACRTLAYRVRRRVSSSQPPGPLKPAWAEPSAVVRTMLTSLAQIQSGVLGFAHQLEKEELFARPPIRTDIGTFAATHSAEKGVFRNRPEEGAQIPLFDDDDDEEETDAAEEEAEEQNSKATLLLEQTLKEARSDAAKQEKRAAVAELRAAELAAELTKLQRELQLRAQHEAEKAAHEQATSLGPKLEAVTQQLNKSEAELRAEREWSGRVDAQLRALHKEATELHQQDAIRSKRLEQERDTLRDTVRRHEEQLQRANQALATWEKAGAEFMTLTATNTTLQQENAALRAEVERLRPLPPHLDSLTRLMVDRVKTLHWLAVWESRAGDTVTGIRLPSYDSTQIVVAAQRHAFAARRDFYFHTRWPGEAKPRWELEDRLLDVDSEKKVLAEAESKNRELTYRLESARRNAGEFP